MSPNNGIYPRKQQKQKTHMCIGKDLLHDGEPYNQHQHQATLQPGEAVRHAMGNNWARARGWRVDEVGLQIQVTYDLTRNWLIFLQSKLGTGGLPLCTCLGWWNVFRVRNFRDQTFGLTKWCELQQLSVSFLGKLKAPQPKPRLVGSLEPSKTGNWNELRSAS